jgi:beta-phosphoglucomutase-like phosphatase (HAD superfamily)
MDFYKKNVLGKVDSEVFGKLMPPSTSEAELRVMSKRKDDCFCELYREHAKAHGPPMLNGLPSALTLAQQLGVRCIAVTNAQRGAGEACIESLRQSIPAASIIDGLVIGAECTRAKPAPDPYFEAIRQLGVQPTDCIIFEDSRYIRRGPPHSLT